MSLVRLFFALLYFIVSVVVSLIALVSGSVLVLAFSAFCIWYAFQLEYTHPARTVWVIAGAGTLVASLVSVFQVLNALLSVFQSQFEGAPLTSGPIFEVANETARAATSKPFAQIYMRRHGGVCVCSVFGRKILQIGLGVASVLTEAEFRAVVGHEMGHFQVGRMYLPALHYRTEMWFVGLLRGFKAALKQTDNVKRRKSGAVPTKGSEWVRAALGANAIGLFGFHCWLKLVSALSRESAAYEHECDRFGAKLTSEQDMGSALIKVTLALFAEAIWRANGKLDELPKDRKRLVNETERLCKSGAWQTLSLRHSNTHPSLVDRVARCIVRGATESLEQLEPHWSEEFMLSSEEYTTHLAGLDLIAMRSEAT